VLCLVRTLALLGWAVTSNVARRGLGEVPPAHCSKSKSHQEP